MKRLSIALGATLAWGVLESPGLLAQGWQPPACEIDEGHFLVRSAKTYVRNASSTTDEKQRAKDLKDADRVLLEALTEKGQEDKSGTWYYLARYYILQEDYQGVDTAFTHLQALAPQCADEISFWKRYLWVPLVNNAARAVQAGEESQAIAFYNQANTFYDEEYTGFLNLGFLYANSGQYDSARVYMQRAIEIGGEAADTSEVLQTALFNIARIYHQDQDWDNAAEAYRNYLAVVPDEMTALSSLAAVLAAAGRTDEAAALNDQILANAEKASADELLAAGNSFFDKEDYEAAVRAYELGLAKNPYHRDGLFNLVNAYLELKNGQKMLEIAERLLAVDPLSKQNLRLLAAAYQQLEQGERTLELLMQGRDLPLEVSVLQFMVTEDGAEFTGQLFNHTEAAKEGVRLVWEFLDPTGTVVATETLEAGAIEPGGAADIVLRPTGSGIVAWRYRLAS